MVGAPDIDTHATPALAPLKPREPPSTRKPHPVGEAPPSLDSPTQSRGCLTTLRCLITSLPPQPAARGGGHTPLPLGDDGDSPSKRVSLPGPLAAAGGHPYRGHGHTDLPGTPQGRSSDPSPLTPRAHHHRAEAARWKDLDTLLLREGMVVGPGFEPGDEVKEVLHSLLHVLVIGAGGLGCELLKDLGASLIHLPASVRLLQPHSIPRAM